MPLKQLVHKLPVVHQPSSLVDDTEAHCNSRVVTSVVIQVTQFGPQCFWVHVLSDVRSDSTGRGPAAGQPVLSLLGSAATAVPLRFPPFVSEISLIDGGDSEKPIPHDGGGGDGSGSAMILKQSASPATAFARSLAARLVKKFSKHTASHETSDSTNWEQEEAAAAGTGIAFTVCCGIAPHWEKILLGAPMAGPSVAVVEFGGQVYREVLAMVQTMIRETSS